MKEQIIQIIDQYYLGFLTLYGLYSLSRDIVTYVFKPRQIIINSESVTSCDSVNQSESYIDKSDSTYIQPGTLRIRTRSQK
jgi:hypothetical protein